MITSELLKRLAPGTKAQLRDRFIPFLNEACPRWNIDTELRVASFLPTICFESDYFRATEEYASGWAYDKSKNPRKAKELGNTEKGDGPKFKGRSLIQRTGRYNYQVFTDYVQENIQTYYDLGVVDNIPPDFTKNPELLEEPFWAVESSCHFWATNNLNKHADKGNFFAVQGVVNRGNATLRAKDYPNREKLFNLALRILPDDFSFAPHAPAPDGAADPAPITLSQSASDLSLSDPASAPSFFDRATGKIKTIQDRLVEMRVDPEKISPASWLTTIATQGSGWALKIWGLITGNILYIAIGAVLVGVAVWYFSRSKDRVAANKLAFIATPANVQINEAR